MPYEPQSVGVAFTEGVDLKADKKITTKLTNLENGRFNKVGAIEKRQGFNAISDGDRDVMGYASYSMRSAMNIGNQLFANNGFYGYSRTGDVWRSIGSLSSCRLTSETIPRSPVDGVTHAQAHLNGYTVYVTVGTGGVVNISTYHEATAAWITVNSTPGTATASVNGQFVIRTAVFDNKIHVLWLAASTTIKRSYMDPFATPNTWSSADDVITTCAQRTFNVVVRPDDVCVLVWPSTVTATAGDLRFQQLTTSGLTGSTTDITITGAGIELEAIGILADTRGNVWVCASEALAWYLAGVNSALTSIGAVTTLQSAAVTSSYSTVDPIGVLKDGTTTYDGVVWLLHEVVYTGTTYLGDRIYRHVTSGLTSSSSTTYLGLRPRSGMMPIRNTNIGQVSEDYFGYFLATYTPQEGGAAPTESTRRETTFLVRDDGEIVGRMFDETGATNDKTLPTDQGTLNPPAKLADGKFTTWWYTNDSSLTTAQALHKRILADFNYNVTSADAGGVALIATASPRIYDGVNLCELGYHVRPEIYSVTELVGGGSLAATSTYLLRAVYRWTDATGRQHVSAPSESFSFTTGGGGGGIARIQAVVSSCRLTARSSVYIDLYITEAGGTIPYYANSTATLTTTTQTTCDAIGSVTTTNQILYTVGGELSNLPPPASNAVIVRDNRAYFHTQDGAIWFSKEFLTGEPPNFSPVLIKTSPTSYGDVAALSEMDGANYAIHERGLRDFVGEGPSAAGSSDTFSAMRSVASDTGAKPGTQPILIDSGILFTSSRGIMQIGRGRTLDFVGVNVDEVADLSPAGAVKLSRFSEAVFFFKDGLATVYNYLLNQWSRWTCPDAVGPAANIGKKVFYPATNGRIMESSSGYTDAGAHYPLKVETAWIKPSPALSNYCRVHEVAIVGEYLSAHDLHVDIYYDYDDTEPGEKITKDATVFASAGKYELNLQPKRQKCSAIKFVIYDEPHSESSGQSYSISGLVLSVSVLGGTNRNGGS